MRTPRPRFPFIISPHQKKRSLLTESAQESFVESSAQILEKIAARNDETGEKISRVFKKMVLLESALDDLLDRKQEDEQSKPELRAFFSGLIPILDSLEFLKRAVEESGEEEWKRGINIFDEKVKSLLASYSFEMSARVGMVFDPIRHESVGAADKSDLPAGAIAQIIEHGWLYHGQVLRFARVIVAKQQS